MLAEYAGMRAMTKRFASLQREGCQAHSTLHWPVPSAAVLKLAQGHQAEQNVTDDTRRHFGTSSKVGGFRLRLLCVLRSRQSGWGQDLTSPEVRCGALFTTGLTLFLQG